MYRIVDLQTWTTVHAVKELAAAHINIASLDIHFDAVKETIRIFFPDV